MKKLFLINLLFFSHLVIPFNNNDEMLNSLKSLLPENPVILEAGGNHGEDTIRMKGVWPNATMHVFEPLPISYAKLMNNTNHLQNVYRYPYALSTYDGVSNFYINIPNNGASSILYPVEWNESEFQKTPIQVQCKTINTWAKENNVTKVDFMWLDMEGFELFALQNGIDILKTVKVIFTEVAYQPVRIGCCTYWDLKSFLESHGFKEIWKTSYGRFGDALFIKQ